MNVPVTPGNLPVGYCPSSYQDLLNVFAANMTVPVPAALSQIVWQASAPTPGSNTAWGKLDGLGRPIGVYFFAQGAWLRLHTTVPGLTIWWFNALPDFTTFDGGDGNTLSPISGPMWQQALDGNGNLIQAAFPVTPGTLPSGKVLGLGGSGGEEAHILVPTEDVPHQHFVVNTDQTQTNGPQSNTFLIQFNTANNAGGYSLMADATLPTVAPTSEVGGISPPPVPSGPGIVTPAGYTGQYQARAHNTMPPYVVGYLLQRTTRLFYIG